MRPGEDVEGASEAAVFAVLVVATDGASAVEFIEVTLDRASMRLALLGDGADPREGFTGSVIGEGGEHEPRSERAVTHLRVEQEPLRQLGEGGAALVPNGASGRFFSPTRAEIIGLR